MLLKLEYCAAQNRVATICAAPPGTYRVKLSDGRSKKWSRGSSGFTSESGIDLNRAAAYRDLRFRLRKGCTDAGSMWPLWRGSLGSTIAEVSSESGLLARNASMDGMKSVELEGLVDTSM